MFASMDTLRKAQGEALERLGFGPNECDYQVPALYLSVAKLAARELGGGREPVSAWGERARD
jgi:hypothetical protein